MDVVGHPMLARQLNRLKRCRRADEIVVATTTNYTDDPVVDVADSQGVRWFRGDEHDVLSRYVGAASESRADIVVRITADCPLIDPEQTDRVIEDLQSSGDCCDYAANMIERTFAKGLDAEAMFRDALERTNRLARTRAAREHVTWFIYHERPDIFLLHSITDEEDNSDLSLTVDTVDDLNLVRRLYVEMGIAEGREPTYRDVVAHLRTSPV